MVTQGVSGESFQRAIQPTHLRQPAQVPADDESMVSGAALCFRDALARVERSERFVERAVHRVSRGDDLSSEELLALQAQVYRASQHAELVSRAVDRVSDTVREITQIRV